MATVTEEPLAKTGEEPPPPQVERIPLGHFTLRGAPLLQMQMRSLT